jgi:hypothetical protein
MNEAQNEMAREGVITPVSIKVESEDEKIELGERAREALRIEQVGALRDALDDLTDIAGLPLDELTRSQLEDVSRFCRFVDQAAGALWWLIPADVYSDEDEA